MKLCREYEWYPWKVERWIERAKKRLDLYGCIDVLAVRPGLPLLGIQSCANSSVAAHLEKIRNLEGPSREAIAIWLDQGLGLEVWGWAKKGPAGKRKTWQVRRVEVLPEDVYVESG